ncbi:FKBP-type peptidyl-prolyl cis-trans isomerase [Mucilaginibacter sp.]|uniref:FKBP-type peptidyl-prolyl cis-trans isomerase n=1 Tax=Mucilaginibacter sp. TaxID=1882438 RepID=UPI0035BC2C46
MKKYILTLSLFLIAFASCKKDAAFDAAAQAKLDDANIQAYLAANPGIKATKDASGVYYQVLTEGTGANPTTNSTVNVNYTGKVLNGTQFATSLNSNSPLSGLIDGWKIGIPKIKTGGRVLLIIPSAYGYGNNSPGAAIPVNSVLIFTIDLINFTN